MDKKQARLRRAARARFKIRELGSHRLCVFRSPRHIYAQLISPDGGRVIASASTVESSLKAACEGNTGNIAAARQVGAAIAERAKSAGVDTVSFDRSGFRYHGRVLALAESAREGGLKF
jgi:large subunit ribosomal protein L18